MPSRRLLKVALALGILAIVAVISYFVWAVHYDDRRNLHDIPAIAETGPLPSFAQDGVCLWCLWRSTYYFASNEGETYLRYTLTPDTPKALTDFVVNSQRP